MKLRNVQAYPIDGVPDHIIQECADLGIKIGMELSETLKNHHPNIILGAINFFHAAMIKRCVSEKPEELEKATRLAAIAMIKNVEYLTNTNLFDHVEDENERTD